MKHDRKVLKVTGADRVKFLGDLITVPVVEDISYGALLSAQGKILADLFVWGDGETHYLDLPSSEFASVVAKLNMYKLRADVSLSESALEVHQAVTGVADPRHEDLGCRHYGDAPSDGIDEGTYLRARIAARVPEFGADFATNEAYPIEWRYGAMGGIDYTKGCYVGQEIAARMRHKAALQKTIYRVTLDGAPDGDEITTDGKPAGKLLSRVGDQALAFLRVKYEDNVLEAGGARLTVHKLA